MKRSGPIRRTARLRPRNARRHRAEWTRAYGSPARVQWVRAQPCAVPGCRVTPCENAHTATGGTSRKADARTIVPLCRPHHGELHQAGSATFQSRYALDLPATAHRIATAWDAFSSAAAPALED